MNKELEHKIEKTLNSVELIEKVTISKDFKQHLLDDVFHKNETKIFTLWSDPKFQIAAAIVVLLVNALVISYVFNTQTETSINSFAQEYSLKDQNTIFN